MSTHGACNEVWWRPYPTNLQPPVHIPLGLQGRALVAAVEHCAWVVVAKLTSVVFPSPEPRKPILCPNAT